MNPELIKRLYDAGTEEVVLDSIFEIEEALLVLKRMADKIDYFKDLKKHRAKSIDAEIHTIETRGENIRQIILATMKTLEPNEKTFQFPDIGKVTRRNTKKSWKIEDEKALLEFFEEQGVKEQATYTKEVMDKKEAQRLVEEYAEQGIVVPGVVEMPESESVSISYEKGEFKPKDAEVIGEMDSLDNLDSFSFDEGSL